MRTLLKFFLLLFIFNILSCGGSSNTNQVIKENKQAPTIKKFNQASTFEREAFTFSATIEDPDKQILSYHWALMPENSAISFSFNNEKLSFIAPDITENTQISFKLTIRDRNNNETSEILNVAVEAYQAVLKSDDFIDKALLNCLVRTKKDYGADEINCKDYLISSMEDLSKFNKLTSLSIHSSGRTDSSLENINSLKKLDLSLSCSPYKEHCYAKFIGLENHTELVELKLYSHILTSATRFDFSEHTQLKILDIDILGSDMGSILYSDSLPVSLEELSLGQIQLDSYERLTTLNNLKKLSLDNYNRDFSLSIFENMSGLTELHIDQFIGDLSPLENLTQLKSLSLSTSNELSTLRSLPQLETLNINLLHPMTVYDSNLYQLQNLKNLTFRSTATAVSLSELMNSFPALASLSFSSYGIELDNDFEVNNSLKSLLLNGQLTNTNFVTKLTNLEHLVFSHAGVIDISPLKTLTQLKSIKSSFTDFTILPDLSSSQQLTEITLINNNELKSIENIAKLKNLLQVELRDLTALSSVTPIASLEKLETFIFSESSRNSQVEDIFSTVEELTQLKKLSVISNQNYPTTKNIFKNLLELEDLLLYKINNFDSFDDLINLPKLRSIYLSNTTNLLCQFIENLAIQRPDIKLGRGSGGCIAQLINYDIITDLNLQSCLGIDSTEKIDAKKISLVNCANKNVSNLHGLEQFTNLEYLIMNGNNIGSLEPLAELMYLEKLTVIHLANNKIEDSSPLYQVQNLETLILSNNNITDLGGIDALEKIKELYLDNNTITDASPLLELDSIEYIDLKGNSELDCNTLLGLNLGSSYKPIHCR